MPACAKNNERDGNLTFCLFDHPDRIPERLNAKIECLYQRLTELERRGRS